MCHHQSCHLSRCYQLSGGPSVSGDEQVEVVSRLQASSSCARAIVNGGGEAFVVAEVWNRLQFGEYYSCPNLTLVSESTFLCLMLPSLNCSSF
jgi:hypothetical protein